MKVTVISSIMGTGKTSWACQKMNAEKDTPFIYVTPFEDQTEDIAKRCKGRDFVTPQNKTTRKVRHNKSDDLRELTFEGRNISTTHKLFENISLETIENIQANGYVLILDEVMDVVKPVDKNPERVRQLLEMGVLDIDEDHPDNTETIKYLKPGPDSTFKEFDHYKVKAAMNRLVLSGETLLMWLFPVSVFSAFKEVFNLTYLFEGSSQHQYYQMHGIDFLYRTVAGNKETGWKLFEYQTGQRLEKLELARFKKLITVIDDDKLNAIGEPKYNLSATWFKTRTGELPARSNAERQNHQIIRLIGKKMQNFFRNKMKAKASECMWAIIDGTKKGKGRKPLAVELCDTNGYNSAHTAFNLRATNKYRHVKYLAYFVNVFPNWDLVNFYDAKGHKFNLEQYAVSELIQWVWRSRIRNGHHADEDRKIVLYLPSRRMRELLDKWLNGELSIS
ncbi:DEAD/DEAH box helicase family protein [uncultured Desulfosarcina sp.]|uniref:DEAD/DEAH box helicase family protein n=1 Tax=uncultured Desulfosarcina sp. TaxID=218289 RepID=UPI0029C93901|nr:DEAD/DEAH box helicase family protein [uncultured Desulfosarcina sp.]